MNSVGATGRTPRSSQWEINVNQTLNRINSGNLNDSINNKNKYGSTNTISEYAIINDIETNHFNKINNKKSDKTIYFKAIIYGLLNSIILVPAMISFCRIIFRDHEFLPYMANLVKLTIISGCIHQFCFVIKSSLPYAVGQVQDAGLIFLSTMASSILKQIKNNNKESFNMDIALSSVLFTLAGSTCLLGIALVITGKLKLASFVQYLPMPVVGGYLAFIGFYCFEAGLSMMSGKNIKNLMDWYQLFNINSFILIIPGISTGILTFYITRKINHFLVLPTCLFLILILFYIILFFIFGLSLQDARDNGWIDPLPKEIISFKNLYLPYKFNLIQWNIIPSQLLTWIAMYFVVAFSSSLDVAAIEMDLGQPLDYNHELMTVGYSNFISGITGGFTGSYIFSQTIFTLRSGIHSRFIGIVICIIEFLVVLAPFSVISYIPKMFFGALLSLVGIDLLIEWIYNARKKMLLREYIIVWLTFIIINITNLELGIIIGIVIAAFNFIYSYVVASKTIRLSKHSHVLREIKERTFLAKNQLSIVVLQLEGYLFFGSSIKIIKEVRKHVLIPSNELQPNDFYPDTFLKTDSIYHSIGKQNKLKNQLSMISPHLAPLVSLDTPSSSKINLNHSILKVNDSNLNQFHINKSIEENEHEDHLWCHPSYSQFEIYQNIYNTISNNKIVNDSLHTTIKSPTTIVSAVKTKFLVLDFHHVTGIDATAVRSCLNAIKHILQQHNILFVLAGVPLQIEKLLYIHDVVSKDNIQDNTKLFDTLDDALEWCEDELLKEMILTPDKTTLNQYTINNKSFFLPQNENFIEIINNTTLDKNSFKSTIPNHKIINKINKYDTLNRLLMEPNGLALALKRYLGDTKLNYFSQNIIEIYYETWFLKENDIIFEAGDINNGIFFVGCGRVDVYIPSKIHERMGPGFKGKKKIERLSEGGILGAEDYCINLKRTFTAQAISLTILFYLNKEKFEKMHQNHPELALATQKAMLKAEGRRILDFSVFND